MAEDNIKKKVVTGFVWRFLERIGAQAISFIVSLVLARLIAPEAYGTIALVTVFTNILQVFVDSGLGTALIQKKNADSKDFSTVFYFNIVICILIYSILWGVAPLIAAFYEEESLVSVVRVLGITIIVSGVKNIQQCFVSRQLLFKKFFFSTLGGTLISAVVGCMMAYHGYGVWAIVGQYLTNGIIDTLILWITVKWRPTKEFSFARLSKLLGFGWKMLVSSLINTFYGNLRQLLIGKFYTSTDLAYYNKGSMFPNLVVTNINSSIDSVLFPSMAMQQDNKKNIKRMVRKSIKVSSYIMWPMMIGLAVCAEPVVKILLTEKWLGAVPYLRIYCLTLAVEPFQTANLNAIKALGQSDIFLKLEIVKKTIAIAIVVVSINFGVIAVALGAMVYAFIATVINSFPNKKLLEYSYIEQVKDICPYVIMALLMGIGVYLIQFLGINMYATLIVQVGVGITVYILLSKIFRIEEFTFILDILKERKENR